MKKRVLKAVGAAVLNLALIAVLIIYFASGAEKPVLSILLPAAAHVSLCCTLLYFLFRNKDILV